MAFYVILTDVGVAKFAAALSGGSSLTITHMVLGDGNGVAVTPLASWTALTNQVWAGAINRVYQSPDEADVFIAEANVPKTAGGWTIREIGLKDGAGDLIAVGSFPARYKALESEGAYEDSYIRAEFKQSNTSTVTIVDNPSAVMATKQYVQDYAASRMNAYHPYHLYLAQGLLTAFAMGNEKLLSDASGSTGDLFGRGVAFALNGFRFVVASVYDLFIYDRDIYGNYLLSAKIENTGSAEGIAISGDGRTIAALGGNGSTGNDTVEIYYCNSAGVWGLQQIITYPGIDSSPKFGYTKVLSPSGNRIVISAHDEDDGATANAGSAYVFDRDGAGVWTQTQRLTASTPTANHQFGKSLALSADELTLAVGVPGYTATHSTQGAVNVYTLSGSTYGAEVILVSSSPAAVDNLGSSVALSVNGDILLSGAPGNASYKGLGCVFTRSSGVFSHTSTLTGSDSAAGDKIGSVCALSANGLSAIIGSQYATVGANSEQGAGYLFKNTGSWAQEKKVVASDGLASDRGFNSVSISPDGNELIFGAQQKQVVSPYQGAMYSNHRI